MTAHAFCTLFDRNYLARGLVLLDSLRQWHPGARVFVLCMDSLTHKLLLQLDKPGVELIRLAELESREVLQAKASRSIAEYCWTLTPVLLDHVLEYHPDVEQAIYLDADMMFFSSPQPLLDESAKASITIIEHRFQPWNSDLIDCGRFNVEWVGFRRTPDGLRCLKRWRQQCLEWCYARLEDGKMGDQKYLDAWPSDYESVHVLQNPGAGVAPWNFSNHPIRRDGPNVWVGNMPLIFFHFHQFQLLHDGGASFMSETYLNGRDVPMDVYGPYLAAIQQKMGILRAIDASFASGISSAWRIQLRRAVQAWLPTRLKGWLKRIVRP